MHAPHWGEPPALLPVTRASGATRGLIELRHDAPRHLIECYDGWRVRCVRAEESGFYHVGLTVLLDALRATAPRIEAIFAGSIFEVIPFTIETAPGVRVGAVQLADCYRFDDRDLRRAPFADRRALLEALIDALAAPRVTLPPLLRASASDGDRARVARTPLSRLIAR